MTMGKYVDPTAKQKTDGETDEEDKKKPPPKRKGEPTKSSRYLQTIFSSFFVTPYHYPGEDQKVENKNKNKTPNEKGIAKVKELIKREHDLLFKWLDRFHKDRRDDEPETIIPLIEKHFEEWYGTDFGLDYSSHFST